MATSSPTHRLLLPIVSVVALLVTACTLGIDSSAGGQSTSPTTTTAGSIDGEEASAGNPSDTNQRAEFEPTTTAAGGSTIEDNEGTAELTQEDVSDTEGVYFSSPSGNIHCRIEQDTAGCAYAGEAPWERGGDIPFWAQGLAFGTAPTTCSQGRFVGLAVDAVETPLGDHVRSVCSDAPYLADEPDITLEYGSNLTVGQLGCSSTEVGVACRHNNGRGFVISYQELSLLLGPGEGWRNPGADQLRSLIQDNPAALEVESGELFETTGSVCQFWPDNDGMECDSTGPIGSGWTPDGESCRDADYYGFVVSNGLVIDGYNGPVMSCTTDVGPLSDPTLARTSMTAGQIVTNGSQSCGSPDGDGMLCWNSNGDGLHMTANELSLMFDVLSDS